MIIWNEDEEEDEELVLYFKTELEEKRTWQEMMDKLDEEGKEFDFYSVLKTLATAPLFAGLEKSKCEDDEFYFSNCTLTEVFKKRIVRQANCRFSICFYEKLKYDLTELNNRLKSFAASSGRHHGRTPRRHLRPRQALQYGLRRALLGPSPEEARKEVSDEASPRLARASSTQHR